MSSSLSPNEAKRGWLLGAIVTMIASGVVAYWAVGNEIGGKVSYQRGIRGGSETVSREDSPSKFRELNNIRWATSGFFLAVSHVCFGFHRKLGDVS